MVIIAVIATGCVDEGKPKYIPGDIIAEKQTSDTFTVILDYNQDTDEYKTNYISKVAGEWRYLVETKHESWDDRRDREDLYPVKIDHVDLTTIMSWDEHLKEMGYEGVSVTPSTKQKYIPGDIIAEKPTIKDTLLVILDYNQNTDEYKTSFISKDAEEWTNLAPTKHEKWYDREIIETVYPVKIDHVDLTTIMSWDEHLKEMGYEGVSATPTSKQKYIPGDIIAEKQTDTNIAWVILNYDQNTDKYKRNSIHKVAGEWRFLSKIEHESWKDRWIVERLNPIKIDHVDLTTIMSWDEYWNEGSYEEVSSSPTPSPTPKLTPKPTSTFIPTPKPTQKSGITGIKIIYSGKWSGSYGDISGIKSIEGSGSKTISMLDADMIISAVIQKQDDSNRKLTLQILKNGKVMEESDTTAAYGAVSAAHTISAF